MYPRLRSDPDNQPLNHAGGAKCLSSFGTGASPVHCGYVPDKAGAATSEIRATATAASMTATNPVRTTSARAIEHRPARQAGITREDNEKEDVKEIYIKCGCLKFSTDLCAAEVAVNAARRFPYPLFLSLILGKSSRIMPASVFGCRYVRTGQPAFCLVALFSRGGKERISRGSTLYALPFRRCVWLFYYRCTPAHHDQARRSQVCKFLRSAHHHQAAQLCPSFAPASRTGDVTGPGELQKVEREYPIATASCKVGVHGRGGRSE